MRKWLALVSLFVSVIASCAFARAQEQAASADAAAPIHGRSGAATSGDASSAPKNARDASAKPAPISASDERAMRIEGEKRFQTNCGRCHMAPHKFAPRTMATVIRHMRVRAMITDEDMRLILRYMSQ
jgi:mono/diheme cytochrome c family protein